MTQQEQIIECPCYPICSGLGVETGQWCRYRKSHLPPPGMHKFNPRGTWCPPGVQAGVLMLGYLVSGQTDDPERLRPSLERVRRWAQALRPQPVTFPGSAKGESP